VGKPDRKRPIRRSKLKWKDNIKMVNGPLGRSGLKWKDNIKTDLQEVGCGHELD